VREARARALLAEKGIFICGFPEHGHDMTYHPTDWPDQDATPPLSKKNESGAPMAEPSLHPESLPGTDPAPAGDLPEESFFLDHWKLLTDAANQLGGGKIDRVLLSWTLGVAAGTISRLETENRLLSATLRRHLDAVR
jgi:hypothetical protein